MSNIRAVSATYEDLADSETNSTYIFSFWIRVIYIFKASRQKNRL